MNNFGHRPRSSEQASVIPGDVLADYYPDLYDLGEAAAQVAAQVAAQKALEISMEAAYGLPEDPSEQIPQLETYDT